MSSRNERGPIIVSGEAGRGSAGTLTGDNADDEVGEVFIVAGNAGEAALGLSGTNEETFFVRGGPDLCLVLLHPDPRCSQQPLHSVHSIAGFLLYPGMEQCGLMHPLPERLTGKGAQQAGCRICCQVLQQTVVLLICSRGSALDGRDLHARWQRRSEIRQQQLCIRQAWRSICTHCTVPTCQQSRNSWRDASLTDRKGRPLCIRFCLPEHTRTFTIHLGHPSVGQSM